MVVSTHGGSRDVATEVARRQDNHESATTYNYPLPYCPKNISFEFWQFLTRCLFGVCATVAVGNRLVKLWRVPIRPEPQLSGQARLEHHCMTRTCLFEGCRRQCGRQASLLPIWDEYFDNFKFVYVNNRIQSEYAGLIANTIGSKYDELGAVKVPSHVHDNLPNLLEYVVLRQSSPRSRNLHFLLLRTLTSIKSFTEECGSRNVFAGMMNLKSDWKKIPRGVESKFEL
jgi:hypothetical protein